jgi:hypothetical protein
MPTDKDFKRLVRARMTKTGESYTAARARLKSPTSPRPKPPARSAPDYAALAGMSDAAVKAKSGCAWDRWVAVLDKAGASEWEHAEIARHIGKTFEVGAWWGQMIAVGYERIKGLRVVGQQRDGGFNVTKSRTFALPLARLYRAFSDKRLRTRWLPGAEIRITTSTTNKSMRFTWSDGSRVSAMFYARGLGKSQVQVEQLALPDKAAVVRLKAFWGDRFGALAQLEDKP